MSRSAEENREINTMMCNNQLIEMETLMVEAALT